MKREKKVTIQKLIVLVEFRFKYCLNNAQFHQSNSLVHSNVYHM